MNAHRLFQLVLSFFLFFASLYCGKTYSVEIKKKYLLKPEHHDIFYGKADRIYLNRFWKFKSVINMINKKTANPKTDIGLAKKYYTPAYNDADWNEQLVPWPWNESVPWGTVDIFSGLGYYRTSFNIPASKKGTRVFIFFYNVQSECTIWVNGKKAGSHNNFKHNSQTGSGQYDERVWLDFFEIDITKLVNFGKKNTLCIRVYDNGTSIWNWKKLDDGGIVGPVYIEFRNKLHLDEILVNPILSSSELEVSFFAENYLGNDETHDLSAEFSSYTSDFYTPPEQPAAFTEKIGKVFFSKNGKQHVFKIKMKNPVLWDIRSPFLYYLKFTVNKKTVGQTRFGFREFRIKENSFTLNNKPVYVLAANPITGSSYNARRDLAWNKSNFMRYNLMLMKEAGIQVIRVHNGPAPIIYYQLCDELGLLVMEDFSPNTGVVDGDFQKRAEMIETTEVGDMFSNGKFSTFMENNVRRWVTHKHNSPSVCMYSAGNEIGHFNISKVNELATYIDEFYDLVKSIDLQKRPITPSSGLTIWQWNKKVKADYYDYHRYDAKERNRLVIVSGNKEWYAKLGEIFGYIDKPTINGECIGFTFFGDRPDTYITGVFKGEAIDKKAYVRWIKKVSAEKGFWALQHYQNVNHAGIGILKNWSAYREAVAWLNAGAVEIFRRDVDFLKGFVLQDINGTKMGLEAEENITDESVKKRYLEGKRSDPQFASLKMKCAPQAAFFSGHKKHLFTGERFSSKLRIINQLYGAEPKDVTITVKLSASSPKKDYAGKSIKIKSIKQMQTFTEKVSFTIPTAMETGNYTMKTIWMENKKIKNILFTGDWKDGTLTDGMVRVRSFITAISSPCMKV
ncbi:glycoside hydrolase family 2 protein [Spirochaetota bacterium]